MTKTLTTAAAHPERLRLGQIAVPVQVPGHLHPAIREVTIRRARRDAQCVTCGTHLAKGEPIGKSVYAGFCLDCVRAA